MRPALLLALLLALARPAWADDAAFARCLTALEPKARAAGISAETFAQATAGLAPDPTVLASLDYQPEFRTPLWDYLAGLVDDERVADGVVMLAEHAQTLAAVQARYGVDPETVVAVWGVESNYGKTFGKKPLVASLATLSCAGRRQSFFQAELFATLKLIQSGDLSPEGLVGSWAGAFGHTQFMPSTYARIAVDFDGDGRRDLVGSIPDALASTAHYLQRAGWRPGQPWGHEVVLPEGFDASVQGRQARRPLAHWLGRGLTAANGAPLDPSDAAAALLLPTGRNGPAFLVRRNFDAIYAYNAAESYALAIAHLSDRLRGGGPLVTTWPTDDPGISRAQRRELQQLLIARGHDIGEADGMIGARTREALALEQARLGLPADGRAGLRSLEALRAAQ
ncbi:MAG: lytic murein transglycosylase [Arenimonas sp.]|nr:lytic murein transglycosylase [Arenimonas sp.]